MNAPIPLTERQEQILRYIASCKRAPTYFEIRDACGIRAIRSIQKALDRLEGAGFIRRLKYQRRAIELLRMPSAPADELQVFRGLSEWTDEQLKAELRRRNRRLFEIAPDKGNWMASARRASQNLLGAIERAGVRPS